MFYKIINKRKRIATSIADIVGYVLWAPLFIFTKNSFPQKDSVREILVIRTAYIGDVMLTMPVLKPMRELFPRARITFLTCAGAKDLFKNCPYVDSVIEYNAFWFYPGNIKSYFKLLKDLRKKRYDLVIEARADIRDIMLLAYMTKSTYRVSYKVGGGGFLLSNIVPFERIKHKVDYHLDIMRYLGGQTDRIDWGIRLSAKEIDKASEFLGSNDGLKVGIHAGGRKPLKCWMPERFAELADRIISDFKAEIFFTGSQQEKELTNKIIESMTHNCINLAGNTNLREGAAVVSGFDLFITNDSAFLHIASAMGTPTVAIFGPSKSIETGPFGNTNRVIEKDFPCRYKCDEDVCCHTPKQECMDTITVDDVYRAVKEVLAERKERRTISYAI